MIQRIAAAPAKAGAQSRDKAGMHTGFCQRFPTWTPAFAGEVFPGAWIKPWQRRPAQQEA